MNSVRLKQAAHANPPASLAEELAQTWTDQSITLAIQGNQGTDQLNIGARIGLARTMLFHHPLFATHPTSLRAAATLLSQVVEWGGTYGPTLEQWLELHELKPANWLQEPIAV